MTKIIISLMAGWVFAWVFGFGITEVFIRDFPEAGTSGVPRLRQDINHGHAYALCALIVFACATIIGLNLPLFRNDTGAFDRIFYTFFALFIPALFGVWCALPQKPKT